MGQTLSEENYLKAIYHLGRKENEKVSLTALAASLDNNAASVLSMFNKLRSKALIDYDKIYGASLTAAGESLAVDIVRKHRLWEVLLAEKLGFIWAEIHGIAEQLEHAHHPELADRLDKFLGFPKHDPHGHPIPDPKGNMIPVSTKVLLDAATGNVYKVVGVKDGSPAFLNYLQQLGIKIGTKITLEQKIDFDQSAVIKIEQHAVTNVSKKICGKYISGLIQIN